MKERPALLFDLDGTLLSSEGDLAIAVNLMRGLHGLPPLDLATVVSYVGDGLAKLAERSLQGAPVPLDAALRELSAFYAEHLVDTTHPLPGVDEGLRALHADGFPIALVTNKPSPHARRLLAHFGWTPLFAAVVAGGDTPERKPHPAPILRALELLNRPPSRAWMIGDHHTDLEAARRAGVRSVFLRNGLGTAAPETPTAFASDFAEMAAWVSGLEGGQTGRTGQTGLEAPPGNATSALNVPPVLPVPPPLSPVCPIRPSSPPSLPPSK